MVMFRSLDSSQIRFVNQQESFMLVINASVLQVIAAEHVYLFIYKHLGT